MKTKEHCVQAICKILPFAISKCMRDARAQPTPLNLNGFRLKYPASGEDKNHTSSEITIRTEALINKPLCWSAPIQLKYVLDLIPSNPACLLWLNNISST